MSESPVKCTLCSTPLKKQIIGSNEFYYCRTCGCTSSIAPVHVPAHCSGKQVNLKYETASGQ